MQYQRKQKEIINETKNKVLNKIKNFNISVSQMNFLGRNVYQLNEKEALIELIYASLNNRNEYFFGIEVHQLKNIYNTNRNFYQLFICDNEEQIFIIPMSFLIEILADAEATNHGTFKQWKPIIRKRNGIWQLRLFGIYNITEHFNRYDYLLTDTQSLKKFYSEKIVFHSDVEVQTENQRWKIIAKENNINSKNLHSATIDMLRNLGEWHGFKVITEGKPIGFEQFPYKVDCLWYKGKDLYMAIEVCHKGIVEKDKDSLKLAKQLGARKVIIVTGINKVERIRKLFMYNSEIKSWTEVWSFNRILNMFRIGKTFFQDFSKFTKYSWNDNIVEYL